MEVRRGVDLKKIDASVKNRFNWRWLESKDNEGYFLSVRMYERSLFLCGSGAKGYCHPLFTLTIMNATIQNLWCFDF